MAYPLHISVLDRYLANRNRLKGFISILLPVNVYSLYCCTLSRIFLNRISLSFFVRLPELHKGFTPVITTLVISEAKKILTFDDVSKSWIERPALSSE